MNGKILNRYENGPIFEMVGNDCIIYRDGKDQQERGAYLKAKFAKENPIPKVVKNSWIERVEGRVYLMGVKGAPEISNYLLMGERLI
jgi:hypothetical protein